MRLRLIALTNRRPRPQRQGAPQSNAAKSATPLIKEKRKALREPLSTVAIARVPIPTYMTIRPVETKGQNSLRCPGQR